MTSEPGWFTLDKVHRGITLAVPGLALATAGGLWAEVRRAANAPVPHFGDLDASGHYGEHDGPPVRLAVLGDSSLTGPGLDHGASVWVAQAAKRLPARVDLRSMACGGSRVRDVLAEQAARAAATSPDLFVVAVGANDAIHLTPTSRFERDLETLLGSLATVAPVLTTGMGDLSMIPRVPRSLRTPLARRCVAMDRVHRRVVERLDGVTRIPVAEVGDPHFRRLRSEVFAPDLFHPNERGHAVWASAFEPYLRAALGPVVDLRAGRGRDRPLVGTTSA